MCCRLLVPVRMSKRIVLRTNKERHEVFIDCMQLSYTLNKDTDNILYLSDAQTHKE